MEDMWETTTTCNDDSYLKLCMGLYTFVQLTTWKKMGLEIVSLHSYVKYLNTNLIWKGHWICCLTKELGSLKLRCKMSTAKKRNAKCFVITSFLQGREALHAYLLPKFSFIALAPVVNKLKAGFSISGAYISTQTLFAHQTITVWYLQSHHSAQLPSQWADRRCFGKERWGGFPNCRSGIPPSGALRSETETVLSNTSKLRTSSGHPSGSLPTQLLRPPVLTSLLPSRFSRCFWAAVLTQLGRDLGRITFTSN